MVVSYTEKDLDLLARIMRAEAIGEGEQGMLMVGNVVINRVLTNCFTFNNTNTIEDVIYAPNQFSGTKASNFYGSATKYEKDLAKKIINGEKYWPASYSLWFCTPKKESKCLDSWYNEPLAGQYKNHCFYKPKSEDCNDIF